MTETLNEYIRENLDDAVDFNRLVNALDGKVNIVKYLDLDKYSSIVDIFSENTGNNVILYYPVESERSGHYAALMYYPEKDLISYFCPYGMDINGDISHSPYLMQRDDRMKYMLPELISDFQEDGGFVSVSRIAVQSRAKNVATCGKHCTFRILFRHIEDPNAYARFLKYKSLTPDEIVTLAFI